MTKYLKYIVTYITVILAIIYFAYVTFFNRCDIYEYMILSLLILIATTFVLDQLEDDRKWKEMEKRIGTELESVCDCKILVFNNTVEWVKKIKDLTAEGKHSFDSAALDKATRSKSKPQYSSIFDYLEDCSKDERIQFRHILRVRKNNLINLINRMSAGSSKKNSFFAFYELPTRFSFPTFGVIDNKYIVTRSPYEQGEMPHYLIIDNEQISAYFVNYFSDLWRNSIKINKVTLLQKLYEKYKAEYTSTEKLEIENKIRRLKAEGIIRDI